MSIMEKLMLSVDEAADVLGVGRSAVYDLLRLNKLASVKVGRSRRIPVAALHRFIEDAMSKPDGVNVA